MTLRICDYEKCHNPAPYICNECDCDCCEDHCKAGIYWQKDADDYGFKVDENGKAHRCKECLE